MKDIDDARMVYAVDAGGHASTFDCSGLTGVQHSDFFIGPENSNDEAPADVYVPGVSVRRQHFFLFPFHLFFYFVCFGCGDVGQR